MHLFFYLGVVLLGLACKFAGPVTTPRPINPRVCVCVFVFEQARDLALYV